MIDYILNILMLPTDTPIWLIPIFGLVTTFVYFAAAIMLRDVLIKYLGRDSKIARAIFFVFGGRFLWQDVIANYVCFAPLVLHWPNRYDEGRTITTHANAIIKHNILDIQRGTLHGFNKWRVMFSIFICRHLGNIDKSHCSAMRDLK
jgi:hypothetical protein